jgi:hypothetical protein
MDQKPRLTDAQVLPMAKVLWSGLVLSLVMYLLTALQMGNATPEPPVGRLEFYLKAGSVALFFLAYLLPRLLARAVSIRRKEGTPPSLSEKFPPYLLRLALFEAVALLGFVLVIRTSTGGKLWPFLIVSAIGFLSSFPSKDRLEAL